VEGFASAALAITMIAAFLLLGFGIRQALRPADRQRGLLMIACGIVFIVNVLIWTF
jgi:hydrogenase/urease accessory protein HupE